MRKKFIAGNWKMYKTVAESVAMAKELKPKLEGATQADVAVAPVFTALYAVAQELKGSNIWVSGQDCHWEKEGAFTGEISPAMLKEAGASHVIIGHSERRQYFGETNEGVAKKVTAALAAGLLPILCVGETLAERESGDTFKVVHRHVTEGLNSLPAHDAEKVTIAYEPVWAIGTGKTATPVQVQEVHAFIRGLLKDTYGHKVSDVLRIQYGGSVKPENVKELMSQPDIDGALVGGASLKADSFEKLVKF
jgi:triosephosphate isomerase